jgi:hypothetical protein
MSRPKLPWRSPLVLQPAEDQIVWIRRLPCYDTPAQAVQKMDLGALVQPVFTTDPPDSAPFYIPWNQVHSWRFAYLGDEADYQDVRRPDDPR